MKRLVKVAAIGAAILATTVAGLEAREVHPAFMAVGDMTSQPIGHYELCQKMPTECAVRTKGNTVRHLTAATWAQLTQINISVNSAIRPATDEEMYGRPEVWSFPTTEGDCEDYVLLKRRLLIQQGWAAGSLLITVVRKPDGEGHAVLTVRTDRGELVLDNLRNDIRLWSDTEYSFVKRQSERNSGSWVSIDDNRQEFVGAVAH